MTSHCPRCQSPVENEWALCPACGLPQPGKRGQITCRTCGTRTHGTYQVCPTCGADLEPAPFPLWPPGKYIQAAGIALLVAISVLGAIRIGPNVGSRVKRSANQVVAFFMPTPTPTATPTGTPTGTPTPTSTPTTTPTPAPSPTPTLTPTETTPTPTEATSTPSALPATTTPTPTIIPTLPRFEAPVLVSPSDGEIFIGRGQFVILRWEPLGPLVENEWYAVRLSWAENGTFAQRGGNNLKETSWQIPADFYWGKADQETGRAYEWYVYVERVTETEDGQRVGESISPPSETRTLYWQ